MDRTDTLQIPPRTLTRPEHVCFVLGRLPALELDQLADMLREQIQDAEGPRVSLRALREALLNLSGES